MNLEVGQRISIPSPIDIHFHTREPGGEHIETMAAGTLAALYGGYQAVMLMPNLPSGYEIWTEERLTRSIDIARKDSHVDVGFIAGVDIENPDYDELNRMVSKSAGLKLYMGHTTGNEKEYHLENVEEIIDFWIFAARDNDLAKKPPILLHALGEVGKQTAEYIAEQEYPVHWSHLSTLEETLAAAELNNKYPDYFTAGVTPHHLTMDSMSANKQYGHMARMMPPLGNQVDSEALMFAFNEGDIKILETDHAPHTTETKMEAERENPRGDSGLDSVTSFGVSGIEFVLPIMFSLVARGEITSKRLEDSLYHQPARLLGLEKPDKANMTELEIGPYILNEQHRVGMTENNPYVGWMAWAEVVSVGGRQLVKPPDRKEPPLRIARILKAGDHL